MRTLSCLLLALLLSGCTGAPADTDGLDADDGAAATADPHVQEATVSWLAPASNGCTDPERVPDVGPGITYGLIEVDEATHGKRFEAAFDVGPGVAVQMSFFGATGEYLGSHSAVMAIGMEPVLRGRVAADAVQAHLTSCLAEGGSATYRAGAIE